MFEMLRYTRSSCHFYVHKASTSVNHSYLYPTDTAVCCVFYCPIDDRRRRALERARRRRTTPRAFGCARACSARVGELSTAKASTTPASFRIVSYKFPVVSVTFRRRPRLRILLSLPPPLALPEGNIVVLVARSYSGLRGVGCLV